MTGKRPPIGQCLKRVFNSTSIGLARPQRDKACAANVYETCSVIVRHSLGKGRGDRERVRGKLKNLSVVLIICNVGIGGPFLSTGLVSNASVIV